MSEPYVEYPKTPRWYRDICVTEKIDGTNARVDILPIWDSTPGRSEESGMLVVLDTPLTRGDDTAPCVLVRAGSKNRWITPEKDNYGFARWVYDHADVLAKLPPGSHNGEWWGNGIQRRYGMQQKVFSLFNVRLNGLVEHIGHPQLRVVPTLYDGAMYRPGGVDAVQECLRQLRFGGSKAAPGWMDPEGVIVWHSASRAYYKATLDGDQAKGS